MNFISRKKLITPEELTNKYPLSDKAAESREKMLGSLKRIISGKENRFIIIVGPCSADNESAVLEYTHRLKALSEEVEDKLLLIPRVYTAKPRTSAGTYKGILHNPNPLSSENIPLGLEACRRLHASVLNETGLATADEILYPQLYEFIDDCLCYGAIGARSSENQFYRLFSSAMDIPVGLKNPTSGNIVDTVNACEYAQLGGGFIYNGEAVESEGNSYAHCILRGGSEKGSENYSYDKLLEASTMLIGRGIKNPTLIIDANHGNSGKDHRIEPQICLDVLESRIKDDFIRKTVKGIMLESYLLEGCQSLSDGVYGKSVTDPCMGWEDTRRLIYKLAELI